ncbi:MAG TPA: hypothetical protein VKP13_11500 [Nitrospira sp.]|nr:hypothetical protein [Nitrospira sp.]
MKKKVHKGGSFLCTDQYCARYIAGGGQGAVFIEGKVIMTPN